MTVAQLRERAKDRLNSLPPDKVRVAVEFLDYLDTAASQDATAELLKMPGVLQDAADASKHIAAGDFKDWREARTDV